MKKLSERLCVYTIHLEGRLRDEFIELLIEVATLEARVTQLEKKVNAALAMARAIVDIMEANDEDN